MPLYDDLFKLNDAVMYLVIEFDAPLGECRLELSLEGANRCGELGNLVTNGVSHIESFLCARDKSTLKFLSPRQPSNRTSITAVRGSDPRRRLPIRREGAAAARLRRQHDQCRRGPLAHSLSIR